MKKHQCSPKFNHNNNKNNSNNRKISKNKKNKNNVKKEDYDYIYDGTKTIKSPWFIKTPFPSRNKNIETHFDCRTNSNTTIKQLLSVPTYNSLSRQLLHKIYVIMVCCCFLIVSFHNGSPFQAHAFPMTTMAPTTLLTSNSVPSTKISRDRDYRETSTRIRTAPGRKSYVFPTPIIDNNDKTLKNTHLRDDNSKQPHDYSPTKGNELKELQDISKLISAHRLKNNGPWFPKRSRESVMVGREEKEVRKHHLNQNFEKLHQTDIHISKKRVKRKTLETLGNQIVKSTKLAINEQQLMSRSKRSLPSYSSYSNNNMLTNHIDQEVPTLNHYNLNYSSASLSHQTKYHPYHNAWKSVCESKQMFACHSLNKNGAVICIDDHNFCDGIYDCPQGEDEDPKSCLFRDNYLFHIRGLIDTMLVTLKED